MINNKILLDGLFGGIGFGIFSYFSHTYNENPERLKIMAYLWGVPLFYFYLLYIAWSQSKKAMLGFTIHAVIGTILTVIVMIITICISNYSMMTVIMVNILLLLIFLFVYFYYKIYEKI
jgi:hypothetical protein